MTLQTLKVGVFAGARIFYKMIFAVTIVLIIYVALNICVFCRCSDIQNNIRIKPPVQTGGFFIIENCSVALGHKRLQSVQTVCTNCVSRHSTFSLQLRYSIMIYNYTYLLSLSSWFLISQSFGDKST